MTTPNKCLYVPGAFYSCEAQENPVPDTFIANLQNSGFNTIINWSFHVGFDGSITNQGYVTKCGEFVGYSNWKTRLTNLKANGSVSRLLLSFAGENTFLNIQNLIRNNEHRSPCGKLYRNFKALYENMAADGIDLDYEPNNDNYVNDLIVDFSLMLHSIGFEVTFCPYMKKSFWVDCYNKISETAPNAVTAFNLQCYSGGVGNDPFDWINSLGSDGVRLVYPSVGINFNGRTPEAAETVFAGWRRQAQKNGLGNLQGGFIWKSNDINSLNMLNEYAEAIAKGLCVEIGGNGGSPFVYNLPVDGTSEITFASSNDGAGAYYITGIQIKFPDGVKKTTGEMVGATESISIDTETKIAKITAWPSLKTNWGEFLIGALEIEIVGKASQTFGSPENCGEPVVLGENINILGIKGHSGTCIDSFGVY